MDPELRILILEDSQADADLLERELRKGGVSFIACRVEDRDAFLRQLEEFQPDLILSDYTLPSFDGLAALELVRQRSPEIPYIFVSGTIGEERAIEALKLGATDYVLKDRPNRLAQAVLRAMREIEERAERKKLEEQFQQAQKMEAIGHLVGGIAHDFNNLLTAIIGYSNLVLSRLHEDDSLRSDIEQIRNAGEHAAALTRQLLAFSRKQIISPRVLDLNSTVANIDRLLRRVIGEDIELVTVLTAGLGRVKVDPGQIEQVIMNLAVNARDAMPAGGKLTIETANIDLDQSYPRQHISIEPGPYVMLAVSDNGCGMDEAIKARLFEPFFTTKTGKGTGLGLATVYGIVKQHGGHIWVYSEPGQGATFKIYLPRVEEPAEPLVPKSRAPVRHGSETVLVVEDEPTVRTLLCRILTAHGYTVLEAGLPSQALEICRRHQGPLHLAVSDVVMPEMNGKELAQRLAELRPQMKFLFLSGYTSNAIAHHGVLDPGVAFLPKPLTADTLARKVREILDA